MIMSQGNCYLGNAWSLSDLEDEGNIILAKNIGGKACIEQRH